MPLTASALLVLLPIRLVWPPLWQVAFTPASAVLGSRALWMSSPALAWLLQRHPAGPMLALCVGQVVLAKRPLADCDERLVRHELCHVRQALRWGLLFPLAYSLASLIAWAKGEGAYWGNAFEREARAAEAAQTDSA